MSLEEDLRSHLGGRDSDAVDAMRRALRAQAERILADAKAQMPIHHPATSRGCRLPAPSYAEDGSPIYVITTLEA